jgi:Zn finger protein HypA/HybF involved in hydrogenase expression
MQYLFSSSVLPEIELSCPKCEWSGDGDTASKEDLFLTDALELYCPQCNHYFGFVSTTLEEEVS